MVLPKKFFDDTKSIIVPQIIEAATDVLSSYEISPTYYSNYFLGTSSFDNINNRLQVNLANSKIFSVSPKNNVAWVQWKSPGYRDIEFFVPRVDPTTRIPCGSKGVKKYLASDQYSLSPDIYELLNVGKVFSLGYDFDQYNGLGKITFDRLAAFGKEYYADTLATLYDSSIRIIPVKAEPEHLSKAEVHLETPSKKAGSQTA